MGGGGLGMIGDGGVEKEGPMQVSREERETGWGGLKRQTRRKRDR